MLWTAAVCVWMAEEPVSSEPVSGSNSLRSGKTTGIYAQERRRFARKSSAFQAVAGDFPNHLNREKNRANSESSETSREEEFDSANNATFYIGSPLNVRYLPITR